MDLVRKVLGSAVWNVLYTLYIFEAFDKVII